MLDVILDSLLDTIKVIPFLFLAYLAMEYLEHKSGDKTQHFIQKSGRMGPVLGGLLGIVPQCGFAAAASNLYTGRVITLGTLISIFLSTSDEMLPILISEAAPLPMILKILGLKALIGILAGIIVDVIMRSRVDGHGHIHDMCEHDHCHCEEGAGVFKAALSHTLQISLFLLLISFALNVLLYFLGEDALGYLLLNRPVIGQLLAGVVGLIPNCAASVVITTLYLEGAMSFGAMMSGLLVGSGIGILVLFRTNRDRKENFKIIGLIYAISVISGIVIELLNIVV